MLLLLTCLLPSKMHAQERHLAFERLYSENGLPSDETNCVMQDDEGFIWIGSEYGLYKYDGYGVAVIGQQSALAGASVRTIVDDHHGRLWIGSEQGLFVMDKLTASITDLTPRDFSNSRIVNAILPRSNGEIWVGTDGGLYVSQGASDTLQLWYNQNQRSLIPHCSVKSIVEASNGTVWVGTWDQGIFRFDGKGWYRLPPFNDANSAHTLFIDSAGRLWAGTWGYGLYHIKNPQETDVPLRVYNYNNTLSGLFVYSIGENPKDHSLWVGTDNGLAISRPAADGNLDGTTFEMYPSALHHDVDFLGSGVESVFADRTGRMWMCTLLGGVASARWQDKVFTNYALSNYMPQRRGNIVTNMVAGPAGDIYLAVKGLGCLRVERDDGDVRLLNATRELTGRDWLSEVKGIAVSTDGEVATGTVADGCFFAKWGRVSHYDLNNAPWLGDNCVFSFLKTDNDWLIGTWRGLAVLHADGTGTNIAKLLDNERFARAKVTNIVKAGSDDYWLGTDNEGIIHLTGDVTQARDSRGLQVRFYDDVAHISRILQTSDGAIWCCSRSGGVMRYDQESDRMVSIDRMFSLPTEIVSSMEDDGHEQLWLATRLGLVRLLFLNQRPITRIFTRDDGLPASYLGRAYTCMTPDGRIWVATNDWLTTFLPSRMTKDESRRQPVITAVSIMGTPQTDHTKITLTPESNDITIEFSTLTYDALPTIRFACRLEGYDADWTYLPVGGHTAHYRNLAPGTYTFRLRATDSNGEWVDCEETIVLRVLPVVWLRWWAWVIYALLAATAILLLARYTKRRRQEQEEIRMAHLMARQTEELNHKKLQFFTNISHDLMTPLTVISTIAQEISGTDTDLLRTNVQKLVRMLGQILSFRKMETGNQHLRVVRRDIVQFCRGEAESISPLMRAKQMTLDFQTDQPVYECYFDPDALDKILYNLLSNAVKYASVGGKGHVRLALTCGDVVRIVVEDNGPGIPAEKLGTLFQRFYEGEHRRFNTYGTGIGLSLTRDLARLHHGDIAVSSKEGEGTRFEVTLPVCADNFTAQEIEVEQDEHQMVTTSISQAEESSDGIPATAPLLLLVEDNTDLLQVLARSLAGHGFRVITATNGNDALSLLEEYTPDLIISDVMMPGMDGFELTRRIKSDITISHIPVLLLTAVRTDEGQTEAFRKGADAYITKPFTMELLHARIDNLLARRRGLAEYITRQITENADLHPDRTAIRAAEIELTDIDATFIEEATACVHHHIADSDFDQQQFADEMKMSKSTLYKKIKALTGKDTPNFIRTIRMATARRLLEKNPQLGTSEIAYAVGYNDPKYFATCFKKDVGMSVSDYASHILH